MFGPHAKLASSTSAILDIAHVYSYELSLSTLCQMEEDSVKKDSVLDLAIYYMLLA